MSSGTAAQWKPSQFAAYHSCPITFQLPDHAPAPCPSPAPAPTPAIICLSRRCWKVVQRGCRRESCNLSHKLRSVIKCKIFNCLQFVWRAGCALWRGEWGKRGLRWAAHFHSCLHSVLATCWAAYIVHMLPLLLLLLAERQSIRNTIKSSQSEKFYAARQSSTKKWRKKLPAQKK